MVFNLVWLVYNKGTFSGVRTDLNHFYIYIYANAIFFGCVITSHHNLCYVQDHTYGLFILNN